MRNSGHELLSATRPGWGPASAEKSSSTWPVAWGREQPLPALRQIRWPPSVSSPFEAASKPRGAPWPRGTRAAWRCSPLVSEGAAAVVAAMALANGSLQTSKISGFSTSFVAKELPRYDWSRRGCRAMLFVFEAFWFLFRQASRAEQGHRCHLESALRAFSEIGVTVIRLRMC